MQPIRFRLEISGANVYYLLGFNALPLSTSRSTKKTIILYICIKMSVKKGKPLNASPTDKASKFQWKTMILKWFFFSIPIN